VAATPRQEPRPLPGRAEGWRRNTSSLARPHPLDIFRRTIELNLIGTFNLNRLQAFHMSANEPEDGERGNEGIAVPVLGARGYQLRLRS
jgi:hypothetical protein